MRFKQVGNKEDLVGVVIKNNDTVQINAGQPVVLSMDGAGVDVVLPSTSAAIQTIWGLRYGVCLKNIAVGAFGEAQVFGFSNNINVLLTSRAATTNSWSTTAALSLGQWLTIDTVNNAFITMPYGVVVAGSIAGSYSTAGIITPVTLTALDPAAILGGTGSTGAMPTTAAVGARTYTFSAGLATSTADTLTAITASMQAFVRMM